MRWESSFQNTLGWKTERRLLKPAKRQNASGEVLSVGIEVMLKNASGSTTWPADTVVLRFGGSGLRDVALRRQGQDIDSVQGWALDSLAASSQQKFTVVLEDEDGNQREPTPAGWLKADYPDKGAVAFGEEALQQTDKGFVGRMTVVRVLDRRLVISRFDVQDR